VSSFDSTEVAADDLGASYSGADSTPWMAFGDLMAGLLGAFVLVVVALLASQLDLSAQLRREQEQRQAEAQRRLALEQALAVPLAAGRVTLDNGRIGISGSVLFAFNSDRLQPEGRQLLYLTSRNEMLMVSGFTDDRSIKGNNQRFADNWELSAQRSLTVTRALIEEGMPSSMVFAAAFGAEQPVTPNVDEKSRSQNRRVEMAPVPKASNPTSAKSDKP